MIERHRVFIQDFDAPVLCTQAAKIIDLYVFLNKIETECLLKAGIIGDGSLVKEILVKPGDSLVKFRLKEDEMVPFLRTGALSFKATLQSL